MLTISLLLLNLIMLKHSNLGNALQDKGMLNEAIDYQKSISIKPNNVTTFINMAILLELKEN